MRPLAASLGSLVVALAGAAATLPAQAVSYTDRATFEAQLSSLVIEGFEGIAAPGSFEDFLGGPFSAGPFTVGTTNCCTSFFVTDAAYLAGARRLGSGATLVTEIFGGTNTMDVTAPGGLLAFGFDFGGTTGTTFEVLLDGVTFQTVVYGQAVPTPQFFGFIADAPVGTVTIVASADVAIYDNFTTGTPNVVPEPATVALLATGLGIVGAVARRRAARA